jgi:hypothetical protein
MTPVRPILPRMNPSDTSVDRHGPSPSRFRAALIALAVGGLLGPPVTALAMWSAATDRPAPGSVIVRDDTMHATLEARLDAALGPPARR